MKRLMVLLALAGPIMAQSPDPDTAAAKQLEELEADRRRLDGQLHGVDSFRANATDGVAAELPRLKAAAAAHPTAEAWTAYAMALAGAGQFEEARVAAATGAKLDSKNELAAVTAGELTRFDGTNGPAVLSGLMSRRQEIERREEVAEARRSLPGIQARAQAAPGAEVLLELAAAHLVLDEVQPALAAARQALALAPKDAIAGMIVEELTRPEPREPAAARKSITMRWIAISAARAGR